jgi:branched-chain amino acid transport system ATP-binding protein
MPARPAAAAKTDRAALRTAGLTVRYGGVCANDSVDLSVAPGELVGLIGPNGAGKTTFIDAVSGFTAASGEVWVGSTQVDAMRAHRRRRLGLARTWQAGELFNDLTVGDNLAAACQSPGIGMVAADLLRRRSRRRDPAVERALGAVGLADAADRRPSDLPLGEQKLVGVARALVGDPSVLLLDEPAAGLDSEESLLLGAQLRTLAAAGTGVLLVDHDMHLVLQACDRLYVMDFGKVIASGRPSEIVADADVVAAYLGSADPETSSVKP